MEERRAFPSLERALCALAGLFVAMNALSLLLSAGVSALTARGMNVSPALLYAASGATELICIGFPGFLWSRRAERAAAGAVRRDPLPARRALLIVAAAVLSVPVMGALSAMWCTLLSAMGVACGAGMAVPQGTGETVACLLSAALVAPVCEEAFFRGRLLAAAEPLGTRRALMLSTVFFALLHGQIGALPVHLCIGAILGLLTVKNRSVYAAVLFHGCYNAATVLFARLPMPATGALPAGTLLLSGVVCAAWALCLTAALLPGARMYTLPPGRRMSGMARAMTVTLILAFSLPYLFSLGGL